MKKLRVSPALLALCAAVLLFVGAFFLGRASALGEARISLFLALERKVFLLIPFILILPHFFADKLFAVFLAEPVADLLAAATTTTLFLLRFRQITRDM